MTQNATITVAVGSNSYGTIVVEWDGQPSRLGGVLHRHYHQEHDVIQLVDHGSVTIIENTIAETKFPYAHEGPEPVVLKSGRGNITFFGETPPDREWLAERFGEVNNVYLWKDGRWFYLPSGESEYEPLFDHVEPEDRFGFLGRQDWKFRGKVKTKFYYGSDVLSFSIINVERADGICIFVLIAQNDQGLVGTPVVFDKLQDAKFWFGLLA